MGSEWQRVALADVLDIISGGTPKTRVSDYWDGIIPWLSVSDFNTGYRWVNSTEKSITERGLNESATDLLNKGDIIISARGTVGVVAQLAKEMAFNQSCYGIRGKRGITDTNFIYYLLRHTVKKMKQVAHGGVFDTITRKTFKIIEVDIPPLNKQRTIAHILGTLDDKIELNRRMNETLEAMARAIFKSWFVNFDPVHWNIERKGAKGQGRKDKTGGVPASSRPGVPALPSHILDLFPDRFEESELGEIPAGWGLSKVENGFNVTMGQSPPGKTYNEEGRGSPFFQGRRDFGFRYPENRVYCTEPKRLAQEGDTLISVRAPVGDINMAYEDCCIGRGVAAVRHKSGNRSFTYYSMHTLTEQFSKYEGEGTVFGSINKKQFHQLPYIAPKEELIMYFEEIVGPLDRLIRENTEELRTLAMTRDTLLPKLISGEVRIPDAEAFF